MYYSDFNNPNELSNYYYHNDSYRGAQITNGYLEAFLGLYGKSTPSAMTCSAVYKNPFPPSGIRIKARVSAMDGSSMSNYNDVVSGIKIQSVSGFNPSDPTWSNQQIHFGFSSPYLTVVFVKGNNPERVYQSGSWNGSDTGWHTLEVVLYSDHIDFYVDGALVYTFNSNPFAGGQVYVGIIAGTVGTGAYARADYLEVDPVPTVVDAIAYPNMTTQQNYVYTPVDATAYPSLSTQQTYVYTPADTTAYPSLSTTQTYVYTPVDTLAYTNLTIPQIYVSPPSQTQITPLPSVSEFYLLVFILFFLMMLALSRKRG